MDGVEEQAELVSSKNNQFVKFKWLEEDDNYYFEIKIVVDELTKDVSLMVTDFSKRMKLRNQKCFGKVKLLI